MINKIIHRDELHHGGFAGLKEHRLVNDPEIFGHHKDPMTSDGLGALIYLADARFEPHGETKMHPHKEVDVITVMVDGNIEHQGSLDHGTSLHTGDVQIQRAGGEGFSHNEINPDETKNRILQLWFQPETAGERAGYQYYPDNNQQIQRVYGGRVGKTFKSGTMMEIVTLQKDEPFRHLGTYEVYLYKGSLLSEEIELKDGDLIQGNDFDVLALSACKFVLVFKEMED